MPTDYKGRVALIVAILYLALSTIFQSVPGSLFWLFDPRQQVSFAPALKPGIDMVGGTSLIYEIKPPEGDSGGAADNLAAPVAEKLKQRVDPNGVQNLIWRPSGNRLEIQKPLARDAADAAPLRDAFNTARDALADTNVTAAQVRQALGLKDAAEQQARLDQLAAGSPTRAALFAELATLQKAVDDADARSDFVALARARRALGDDLAKIEPTNLAPDALRRTLDLADAGQRDARLAEHKRAAEGFGPRLAAIDAYARAYAAFKPVADQVGDVEGLKDLLRGSGVLSFHILAKDGDVDAATLNEYRQRLAEQGPRARSGDQLRWLVLDDSIANQVGGVGPAGMVYDGKPYVLAWDVPGKSMSNPPGRADWALASVGESSDDRGHPAVGFRFDDRGARLFSELTGRHQRSSPGGPYTLMPALDGRVLSLAEINQQIGASGIITGRYSPRELSYLVTTLGAGSLPAQLNDEPIVERTVGPQLGADNLRRGLFACAFGVAVVAVFLIGYYYLSGVVAFVAVFLNLILILAGMVAFGATFTLPSVAGIILTIGMAVDANVLIFERLREEQARGLGLRVALRNAYDRAATAIWDANITTSITALILYLIGTEDVKGFGLTLLLGLVSSLFTALYVTKTIFGLLIEHAGVTKLRSLPTTFPAWNRVMQPNINWMRLAPVCLIVSAVCLAGGLASFGYAWSKNRVLDTEFAGGTTAEFRLREATDIGAVRALVEGYAAANPGLTSPRVQAVGDDRRTFEVITPTDDAPAVRAALQAALAGKLDAQPAVRFAGDGADLAAALAAGTVVPVTETATIEGLNAGDLADYAGGVAVVVRNPEPALETNAAELRLDAQREASAPGLSGGLDVRALPDGTGLVVLGRTEAFPYDAADARRSEQWQASVAAPAWAATVEALSRPADLQRVNNIERSVGRQAQVSALMAIVVSVFFIVAYIWLRFGDFKYGLATVVGTVHDALFTLAALGLTYLVAETLVGRALLLEPFRIDLVMIAAIMTVIGYSLNDKVVVFDRIRENRGKRGFVDRQTINDSINQTLSRTLLTGGTTIVTIFVMYLLGGSGIHGFTYVLLVGILVGTYSSIAVASPILLLGQRVEAQAAERGDRPTGIAPATA